MNDEANKRLNEERQANEQNKNNMQHTWNQLDNPVDHDAQALELENDTELDEDNTSINIPNLRKGASRVAKKKISYDGLVGSELGRDTYSTFLVTVDLYGSNFSFSSASSYFAQDIYLIDDDTSENMYP